MRHLKSTTLGAALLVALAACGSDADTGRKLSRLTPTTDGECTEGVEACLAMEGGEPQCGCFVAEAPITEGECDDQGGAVEPILPPDPAAEDTECEEGLVAVCVLAISQDDDGNVSEETSCACVDPNDSPGSTPGGGAEGDPDNAEVKLDPIVIDAVCVIPPNPGEGDPMPLGPTPDPNP